MNFHVESSLAFSFRSKVFILNLRTSLRPRHLKKKHGTNFKVCAYYSALCWQSFSFSTKSVFFSMFSFPQHYLAFSRVTKVPFSQYFARSSNIERMQFIRLGFKYNLVHLMVISASCCDSSRKLVALKLLRHETIFFTPKQRCFLYGVFWETRQKVLYCLTSYDLLSTVTFNVVEYLKQSL